MPDAPGERGPFAFVQLEFGFLLGPGDGRYLVRAAPDAEPELVVALRTLGAPERRRLGRRRPRRTGDDEPAPVPTNRATLIRAEPLAGRADADEWLARMRSDRDAREREVDAGLRALNAVLRAHRAAAADPYAREVTLAQPIAVRVGHGSGEQVAEGRFAEALDVPPRRERRRRVERIEPQERLAAILGGRESALAGEELVLRARLDLDVGRPREAALQARIALEVLLAELARSAAADLEAARAAVARAANAALAGELGATDAAAVEDAVARMERALRRRAGEASAHGP